MLENNSSWILLHLQYINDQMQLDPELCLMSLTITRTKHETSFLKRVDGSSFDVRGLYRGSSLPSLFPCLHTIV